MDEPCSALDPVATAKVEELIHKLKKDYTIVVGLIICSEAARVSDRTAFFYLGRLVEYETTEQIFMNPKKFQDRGLCVGSFWLSKSYKIILNKIL